ncbi:MAG: ATPase [Desulfobacteraceae bacterium 4572_35.2]|nr:MAG: ATPase [Desulfobacteraceae bacterium 4572_35.2]
MATAEQIKSLIRSHFGGAMEHFASIALQVAAHEARQGHSALAHDIRNIVDSERKKSGPKVISFPKDLRKLILTEESNIPFKSMVAPQNIQNRLERIIHEYRQQEKLKSHGLMHRRKILLIGPSGTGKTLTAKILSNKLQIPLHTIQVDRLVTKFMGETSAKLRQIFEMIQDVHGIYLFDEFDAIGGDRSSENDIGEMRRVLNAFLQFIEQDNSDSLIIAATNNPKLLDKALFRRFDDVMYYENPKSEQRKILIENVLGTYKQARFSWKKTLIESERLSYAEIADACKDTIKNAILSDKNKVTASDLLLSIKEKKGAHVE